MSARQAHGDSEKPSVAASGRRCCMRARLRCRRVAAPALGLERVFLKKVKWEFQPQTETSKGAWDHATRSATWAVRKWSRRRLSLDTLQVLDRSHVASSRLITKNSLFLPRPRSVSKSLLAFVKSW